MRLEINGDLAGSDRVRRLARFLAIITLAFLRQAVPAWADDEANAASAPSPVMAQIEQLKDQIRALQEKLERLLKEQENAKQERRAEIEASSEGAQKPQAQTAPPQEKQVPGRGLTEKGLYYGLAAGPPGRRYGRSIFGEAVKIGGYGSFRFEANNIDPGPRIADLPAIRRGFDSFDFRRFVLTADAAPFDRLRVYMELELERLSQIEIERTAIPENRGVQARAGTRFIEEVEGQGGSEIAVEQAWAQFDLAKPLSFRMGVVLPPLGRFNILHDDDYWDIPRRPLVDRGGPVIPIKSAWKELGAGLLGNIPVRRGYIDYQFYVVNGAQLDFAHEKVVSLRSGRALLEIEPEIAFFSGPFNGTKRSDAMTWRVAISPKLGNEFALSGYHGRYTPSYLKVNSSINAFGFDGKLTLRNFELEGEFVYTDFGRMEAVLDDISRQLVNSSAETASSETRTIETEVAAGFAGPLTNQRYGFWVDFKYRFWPRFLDGTLLGKDLENPQLIPIFRFERIWFNDFVRQFSFANGAITGLNKEDMQQQRTTLGLTYRPATSIAFTAAYEHNRRIKGSSLIFPRLLGLGHVPDKSYDSFIFGVAFGF